MTNLPQPTSSALTQPLEKKLRRMAWRAGFIEKYLSLPVTLFLCTIPASIFAVWVTFFTTMGGDSAQAHTFMVSFMTGILPSFVVMLPLATLEPLLKDMNLRGIHSFLMREGKDRATGIRQKAFLRLSENRHLMDFIVQEEDATSLTSMFRWLLGDGDDEAVRAGNDLLNKIMPPPLRMSSFYAREDEMMLRQNRVAQLIEVWNGMREDKSIEAAYRFSFGMALEAVVEAVDSGKLGTDEVGDAVSALISSQPTLSDEGGMKRLSSPPLGTQLSNKLKLAMSDI